MKKVLLRIFQSVLALYVVLCLLMYFFQEKMIFFPEKLETELTFSFEEPFEEVGIRANDGALLHGLLFKTDSSKGLIFYLHGNGGSVRTWGESAKTYTDLHYDVFMLDYRSYGKSQGKIRSQQQLFNDMQSAYDVFSTLYDEKEIILIGYSLGTGFSARLASTNNPKMLILQAPYYSIVDIVRNTYPFIPTFLLKYKLKTHEFIEECSMPVVFIHGDADEMIPMDASERLRALAKANDTLIILPGQGHNGITANPVYLETITGLLD